MTKFLIAVDSGHGMETPGKRTPPLLEDIVIAGKIIKKKGEIIHEKEWNRAVADKLIAALKRCGFDTLDVSPGLKDVPLADRYNAANDAKADAFISKHYNAATSNWWTPGYTLAFVSQYASTKARTLAKYVQDECAAANGWRNEGVQNDYAYMGVNVAVLRRTNMPAVLTETGFMDVWDHAKKMIDPDFIEADAEATCRGICKFFGVKYVQPEKEVVVTIPTPVGQYYAIQLGAYSERSNAEKALEAVKAAGFKDAYLLQKDINKKTYSEV